jgi:hypothetical protein
MSAIKKRAQELLSEQLRESLDPAVVDRFVGDTHTQRFADNLLPTFSQEQIATLRKQLAAGGGRELDPRASGKRRAHAPYSSAALAVNAFGRWLGSEGSLRICGLGGFDRLEVEGTLKISHGGGTANLDVLLKGTDRVVGIESKLTEYLEEHPPTKWEDAYFSREMQAILSEPWQRLLETSRTRDWTPNHLDIEQLIKHALALTCKFPDSKRHLIYCFWEPENDVGVVEKHRSEVNKCRELLEGADPVFHAVAYSELLDEWKELATPEWLPRHVALLESRYGGIAL